MKLLTDTRRADARGSLLLRVTRPLLGKAKALLSPLPPVQEEIRVNRCRSVDTMNLLSETRRAGARGSLLLRVARPLLSKAGGRLSPLAPVQE